MTDELLIVLFLCGLAIGLVFLARWAAVLSHPTSQRPAGNTGPALLRVNGKLVPVTRRLAARPTENYLWYQRGWRKDGDTYTGSFKIAGKSYRGAIERSRDGYRAYIHQPLKSSVDLKRVGDRYQIHFSPPPATVDHALVSTELALIKHLGGHHA